MGGGGCEALGGFLEPIPQIRDGPKMATYQVKIHRGGQGKGGLILGGLEFGRAATVGFPDKT